VGESIYFVSDTHFGDGSKADRFLYPRPFFRLLERVAGEPHAHLVLLGDMMELWSAGMEGVLLQYAPFFRAIAGLAEQHPVTYVVGNHDCLPWYHYLGSALGRVRVTERFEAARGTLVAVHGHQFDPFNRVKTEQGHVEVPWTRRLTQMVGLLQRLAGDPARKAVDNAADWLGELSGRVDDLLPEWDNESRSLLAAGLRRLGDVASRESPGMRGYPAGETSYEQAAIRMMREGARFVLMGHTHHPLRRVYGERVYVNTGSWVWDRYPPTYGLYRDGRLLLIDALAERELEPG
jgi:UDP-2,3-diacylglucosamine pyrophosphatase LpxH